VILLIAAIFHYSASVLGKKVAIAIAAAVFSILLIFLDGLTIKEAGAANEINKEVVQFSEHKNEPAGWPAKISQLQKILQKDRQQGLEMMKMLLEQEPPMFFADEIAGLAGNYFAAPEDIDSKKLLEFLKNEQF
jgi:hypothetical protein